MKTEDSDSSIAAAMYFSNKAEELKKARKEIGEAIAGLSIEAEARVHAWALARDNLIYIIVQEAADSLNKHGSFARVALAPTTVTLDVIPRHLFALGQQTPFKLVLGEGAYEWAVVVSVPPIGPNAAPLTEDAIRAVVDAFLAAICQIV